MICIIVLAQSYFGLRHRRARHKYKPVGGLRLKSSKPEQFQDKFHYLLQMSVTKKRTFIKLNLSYSNAVHLLKT